MPCENANACPCPRTECERHKKCCECVKSHREREYLPHCLRPAEQDANQPVIEAIRKRRSIRRFKPGAEITDEQIKLLLEAAMLAPSACNTRPWEFIVVKDREKLDQIRKAHPYTGMLETASLAIVMCALPEAQADIMDGLAKGYYPQDCGAATQNILIQAIELGLGTCWCGVYPKEDRIAEIREILGTTKLPFNVIAVGLPDEDPDPRGRYDENKVRYM